MAQPINVLQGMYGNPMGIGVPQSPQFGFTGIPFLGNNLMGASLVAPFAQQEMLARGFNPFGLGHDQNAYDLMRKQQFTMMQQKMVADAALLDRQNHMRTFQGMAALSGVDFGPRQRQYAGLISDVLTMGSPFLAAANPDLVDSLSGPRGSAAVLASRIADRGRYMADPVTGRMGLSDASSRHLMRDVYNSFYDVPMPAGQIGGMLGELQSRGFIGTGGMDIQATTRQMLGRMRAQSVVGGATGIGPYQNLLARNGILADVSPGSLRPEELDRLAGDDAIAGKLRSLDSDKVKRKLSDFTKSISAIRDIMGDAGHPNAPMRELVQALEALTLGSMQQIDPARVGMIARQTYNLAKQAGIPVDNAMVLQQHVAGVAAAQGQNPLFAVSATQGALAYNGALRASGMLGTPVFGAMSADQMTKADAEMRLSASNSAAFNQLATLTRISETAGGFAPDSEAGKLMARIRAGTATPGMLMGGEQFLSMVQGSRTAAGNPLGMSQGQILSMLDQRGTNASYGERYGLQGVVAGLQTFEAQRLAANNAVGPALVSGLQGAVSAEAARKIADSIKQDIVAAIDALPQSQIADPKLRTAAIAKKIEAAVAGTPLGDALGAMTAGARSDFLGGLGGQVYGALDQFAEASGMGAYVNIIRRGSPDVARRRTRDEMRARLTAQSQDAMTGLTSGTMLGRMVGALQDSRTDDPNALMKVAAEALGGVSTGSLNQPLVRSAGALARLNDTVLADIDRVSQMQPGPDRDAAIRDLDAKMAELKSSASGFRSMAERLGIGGVSVTPNDARRFTRSVRDVLDFDRDLAGYRGGAVDGQALTDQMGRYNRGAALTGEEAKFVASAKLGRALTPRDADFVRSISVTAAGNLDPANPRDRAIMSGLMDMRLQDRASTATAAEIASIRREMPHLSETEASSYADAEARRRRFLGDGSSPQAGLYQKTFGMSRGEAVDALIRKREELRERVTDADIDLYVKTNGLAAPDDATREEIREQILKGRIGTDRERAGAYLQSRAGAEGAAAVERFVSDGGSLGAALIADPATTRKFGHEAIRLHKQIKGSMTILQSDADAYAGGSIARLLAGHVDVPGATYAEQAKLTNEVRARSRAALAGLNNIGEMLTYDRPGGGNPMQIVSVEEALMSGGINGIRDRLASGLTGDLTVDGLRGHLRSTGGLGTLGEEDRRAVFNEQARLGNIAEAMAVLGIDRAGKPVSEVLGKLDPVTQSKVNRIARGVEHARRVGPAEEEHVRGLWSKASKAIADQGRNRQGGQELLGLVTGRPGPYAKAVAGVIGDFVSGVTAGAGERVEYDALVEAERRSAASASDRSVRDLLGDLGKAFGAPMADDVLDSPTAAGLNTETGRRRVAALVTSQKNLGELAWNLRTRTGVDPDVSKNMVGSPNTAIDYMFEEFGRSRKSPGDFAKRFGLSSSEASMVAQAFEVQKRFGIDRIGRNGEGFSDVVLQDIARGGRQPDSKMEIFGTLLLTEDNRAQIQGANQRVGDVPIRSMRR